MSDLNELTQARQWPDSADTHIALVLAGGMALGAYQGGAYEKLHAAGTLSVDWLAGSSVEPTLTMDPCRTPTAAVTDCAPLPL